MQMFPSCRAIVLAMSALAAVVVLQGCNKNDVPGLIASAKSYMAKSDQSAAIIQLKSALQQAPDNPEARFLLAKSYLENGEPGPAETEFRKALDLNYPRNEIYPLLARAMLAQGQFAKLVTDLGDRKLDNKEAMADLGTSVATAHLAQGDPKAALSKIGR